MGRSLGRLGHFSLPEVWNNEVQMYTLFAAIKRPRALDPVSYDLKVGFWKELIMSYANYNRIVIVTEKCLIKIFQRNFGSDGVIYQPKCLHQVLNEMAKQGLVSVAENNSLIGTALKLGFEWIIKKPASMVWALIKGEETSETGLNRRSYGTQDSTLILTELVPHFCENFIEQLKLSQESLTDDGLVYPFNEFEETLTNYFDHIPTRLYILDQLVERMYIKIVPSSPVKLVFVTTGRQITKFDIPTLASIAHLRNTIKKLIKDQDRILKDIANKRDHVKKLAKCNRKQDALKLLRLCKHLESDLARKAEQLARLEALELEIGAAQDNRTVIHALLEASVALKRTTGGLEGIKGAEKVLDEIADTMDDVNHVSQTLAAPNDYAFDQSVEELTDELEKLLGVQSLANTSFEDALPSPPEGKPGADTYEADGNKHKSPSPAPTKKKQAVLREPTR